MTRFFFIHCTKTGGTSLNNQLHQFFDPENIYPRKTGKRKSAAQITRLDNLRTAILKRPNIEFVTGHFPFCAHEILGPNVKTFTILRDPVERTLSALRFRKKVSKEYKNKTLQELYENKFAFHTMVHNHMTKVFSMGLEDGPNGLLQRVYFTEEHLKTARRNLRKVDVIGITEEYQSFCKELERKFGWEFGDLRHDNKTKSEPATPSLINQIKRDNLLDIRLYKSAKKIIENRRRAANDSNSRDHDQNI